MFDTFNKFQFYFHSLVMCRKYTHNFYFGQDLSYSNNTKFKVDNTTQLQVLHVYTFHVMGIVYKSK